MDLNGNLTRRQILFDDSQDFGDILYTQLRNAPWVMCSVGVHAVAVGFLLLLPAQDAEVTTAKRIQMSRMVEQPQLDEPEEPEIVEDEFKPETEKEDVDPVLVDAKDPTNETPDHIDDHEALGDPTFDGKAPFEGAGENGVIGIGGNAGGSFGGGKGGRKHLRASSGGSRTESSVELALEWLKNHQSPGGHWDCDGFSDQCKLNDCGGPGEAVYDPGVSGLALLCFLGAGETHIAGQYKSTVKNGLRYLKNIQDSEGCFGPRTAQHFQYNHMTAALAMTEAYGLTGSRIFKDSAQRGVNFVQQSQNPYLAWRYGVRDGDNDTSVTGWAAMVLKSAKLAELEVDGGAMRGALGWVEKMTEPEFGRVGYQRRGGPPARTTDMMERFPADQSEALTGVGVLVRIFAGQDPKKNEMINKGADLIVKKAPRWDLDAGTVDYYHWYYSTLAMFQVGGERWKTWNKAMKTAIVDHQRTEVGRDERGSWDPVDPWAAEGGRIYATTMNCLCLEVYYRYGRVFGTHTK